MRKYTLVFSVIAHLGVIAAVYIAPAFATDELPEPPRTSAFIIVRPIMPEPPPVLVRKTPAPSLNAAPFEPPDGVQPERPVDPSTPPGIDDLPSTTAGVPFGDGLGPGEPVPPPPPVQRPKEPVPVGGVIRIPTKVVDAAPVYPRLALEAHKEGVVILQAVIAEDGSVRDVKVLRTQPLLDQAAVDAVRQWRFTPSLLNGEPVPVVMTVTVTFTLDN